MTHFGSTQELYSHTQQPTIPASRIYGAVAVGVLAVSTAAVTVPVAIWCAKHKLLTRLILKVVL